MRLVFSDQCRAHPSPANGNKTGTLKGDVSYGSALSLRNVTEFKLL